MKLFYYSALILIIGLFIIELHQCPNVRSSSNHNTNSDAYFPLTRVSSSFCVCNNHLQSGFVLMTPDCHCLKINQLVFIIMENTPILSAGRERAYVCVV